MPKPIREWTKVDLTTYIGADETSDLEFKSSAALDFSGSGGDKHRAELAKDASAMANANGGLIIYGIKERAAPGNAKHKIADSLDDGTGTPVEQIRQILSSNIEPKIAGLEVWRIPFENGLAGYVLEIPPATTFAPHQSKIAKIYYRRLSTTTEPMLDHEVRDLMRRGTTPALDFEFDFQPIMDGYFITAKIINITDTPSLYTSATLAFDRAMRITQEVTGASQSSANLDAMSDRFSVTALTKAIIAPSIMPIFRGNAHYFTQCHGIIKPNMRYAFAYSLACPGFSKHKMGYIIRLHEEPFLEMVTDRFEIR